MIEEPVIERAHAKLNVFLRVLGPREDGYHDIQTVVLPLDLHDVVTLELGERFEVAIAGPRAGELEASGGEALVTRAARALASDLGVPVPDLRITVEKRIPVGAGMGGGSADAAAVLRALGGMLDVASDRLAKVAAAVGADVPALLHGGPVYADGRGSRVEPVHAFTTTWVVKPFPFTVRAADAYAWWDESPVTGPDPGAVVAALETGNDDLLGSALFDDLQTGVVAHHPPVRAVLDAFDEAGALGAIMTGSGPTVVALARHLGHADSLAAAVPGSFVTTGPPRTMSEQSGVV